MQWIHRPHRHQRIEYNTRLRIFAEPHIDLEDRAIDRRLDYRLVEIDPRLVECRLRLAKLCPGFFALGRQDLDLLLRAGKSGLCSDNARVGFLSIGRSGFKTLARCPRISGELGVARVIERRPDALGFGAVEYSAGLIDGIAL